MDRRSVYEEAARVVSNQAVAPNLFILALESPQIAVALQPGQFVHMQVPGMPDRILRRPFSIYRVDAAAGVLSILYQVVGVGTQKLSEVEENAWVSLVGPVGNAWDPPLDTPALLVGGGVGAAPLFMLAEHIATSGSGLQVILGAQTKEALVTYDTYCTIEGAKVVAATDDGSFGYAGFCTVPAGEAIQSGDFGWVGCCGPEPVMRIVAGMCKEAQVPCWVSLERRMACGVGACLSCVVDTLDGKKRCCVDGPVFNAGEVVW